MTMPFNNTYIDLPERFYARQLPTPVTEPELIKVNRDLAQLLNIDADWLASAEGVSVLAGNHVPDGSDPIATTYAGHQFGNWNPQLGDGRAILLGELIGTDGERYDLQLKGSGQTPYSRMGDGRAPLGPVIREYLLSEAMAALGIATSRSLAMVTTGELVHREQSLPGGVLARVAKSHIRIGTMQFFAGNNDVEGMRLLADHIIDRHYPEARDAENPVLSMFRGIMSKQAKLVTSWQMVGFIHGVMNTDNMLLSGETIDYGPCAFMDIYDPGAVFSSIDHAGRYAYRNQPGITHWNLACLAQALAPLFSDTEEEAINIAKAALEEFPAYFLDANSAGLRSKVGLTTTEDDDDKLVKDFLDLLEANACDFTLAFRRLSELPVNLTENSVRSLFDFPETFAPWLERWAQRCQKEDVSPQDRSTQMLRTNPALIPRNHLVEAAIAQAYTGDLSLFHQLTERLNSPFEYSPSDAPFATPPTPEQIVQQTFCGT